MKNLKLVLEKQSKHEVLNGMSYGPTFTYTLCFSDGTYVDNATVRAIAQRLPAGAHVMDGHLDVRTQGHSQAKILSSRKLTAAERVISAEGLEPKPLIQPVYSDGWIGIHNGRQVGPCPTLHQAMVQSGIY